MAARILTQLASGRFRVLETAFASRRVGFFKRFNPALQSLRQAALAYRQGEMEECLTLFDRTERELSEVSWIARAPTHRLFSTLLPTRAIAKALTGEAAGAEEDLALYSASEPRLLAQSGLLAGTALLRSARADAVLARALLLYFAGETRALRSLFDERGTEALEGLERRERALLRALRRSIDHPVGSPYRRVSPNRQRGAHGSIEEAWVARALPSLVELVARPEPRGPEPEPFVEEEKEVRTPFFVLQPPRFPRYISWPAGFTALFVSVTFFSEAFLARRVSSKAMDPTIPVALPLILIAAMAAFALVKWLHGRPIHRALKESLEGCTTRTDRALSGVEHSHAPRLHRLTASVELCEASLRQGEFKQAVIHAERGLYATAEASNLLEMGQKLRLLGLFVEGLIGIGRFGEALARTTQLEKVEEQLGSPNARALRYETELAAAAKSGDKALAEKVARSLDPTLEIPLRVDWLRDLILKRTLEPEEVTRLEEELAMPSASRRWLSKLAPDWLPDAKEKGKVASTEEAEAQAELQAESEAEVLAMSTRSK